MLRLVSISAVGLLVACAPSQPQTFPPPEASGLVAGAPYRGPDDICRVIGENELTQNYLDHTATLVGCPKRETGAIADREAEGGVIVGQEGSWVLISIPDA